MVFVVERYLPGVAPSDLLRALARLGRVTESVRNEGRMVTYLGSTIVPDDEACFCQFDASSEEVVAEVNRRAELRFDRIVEAVGIAGEQRPAARANQRNRRESS